MTEREMYLRDLGSLRTKEEEDELVALMLDQADDATSEIYSRLWPEPSPSDRKP